MTPAKADYYYWRILATALCFISFGVGALALSTLVFPALYALPPQRRAYRARWCIHKCFAAFMWVAEHLGLMRFEISGLERLHNNPHHLILANHPTLIDVVALMALIPNASCVVKQALWRNPFVAAVVRTASYISNADSEGIIEACAEDLKQPRPLIIFPEGTRSTPDQPLQFQRGAAYIALKSGAPILPVLIRCSPHTLTKGSPWYRIPHRKFVLQMDILPVLQASTWVSDAGASPLQARRLTTALENFFTDQLNHYEPSAITPT